MALATALGMVLRRPLVALLFDYGKFGQPAVDMTAETLLFLLLGLVAESMIVVLARGFYAGHDTRTPVASAVLAVVINVALGFALVGPLGLAGLGIALAAGAWAEAAVLLILLDRRYAAVRLIEVVRVLVQCALAGAAAAVAAFAVLELLGSRLGAEPGKVGLIVELLVAGGLGCLVYAAAAALLRISELSALTRMAGGLVARSPRP